MIQLLRFGGAFRLSIGAFAFALLLALGTQGRAGAPMSTALQQKVDFESTKVAPAYCAAYLKASYDCTCFSKTVHDYRMKEFAQKGESMLVQSASAGESGMTLDESLNDIVTRNQLDFSKCLLPGKSPNG